MASPIRDLNALACIGLIIAGYHAWAVAYIVIVAIIGGVIGGVQEYRAQEMGA